MLQVTVPDGVVEGGQFQANTPNGPVLDTVPPGVKSGQVIQISAPGPMVMERTERSDASNAMVGTWTLVPSGSCSSCSCCGGASADMVITESNQVQTIYCENSHRCCGWIRASKGSGSRGVMTHRLRSTRPRHRTMLLRSSLPVRLRAPRATQSKWNGINGRSAPYTLTYARTAP